jgi:hypothetical protein
MKRRPTKVLLTRRRWDAYFAPLFIVATAIGIVRVWQSGELRVASPLVAVIMLWMMLRLTTPREGKLEIAISDPSVTTFLSFAAVALAYFALMIAIDVFVFHHPLRAPVGLYHTALFAPAFIIMFVGIYRTQRIINAQMSIADDPRDEA